MRKLIPLVFAIFALTACEQNADMSKLDNRYLVYTNYDKQADFSAYSTYYLPDSILVIGDKAQPEYWTDQRAQAILSAYVSQLDERGFVRVHKRNQADLGLQISYVESTYFFTDYGTPEWWWNYPGYWDALYWGEWGGWYYPYAVSYSYSSGSFLGELLNLTAPEGKDKKLPILWNSYMTGLLSGSTTFDTHRTVEGVYQSFLQSPYLTHQH